MWNDLKDKTIVFPSTSSAVLVTNKNLDWWEPNKYYLINVGKLLDICDTPYNTWTHWMEIPSVEENNNSTMHELSEKYVADEKNYIDEHADFGTSENRYDEFGLDDLKNAFEAGYIKGKENKTSISVIQTGNGSKVNNITGDNVILNF